MTPRVAIILATFVLMASSNVFARRNHYRSRARARMLSNLTNSSIPVLCDKRPVLMTSTHGTLRSPGYPQRYAKNQRCTWHIGVPSGFRIRLKFRRQFGIETSVGCSKDYIMISRTKDFKNPLTFCGRKRPSSIFTPGNDLWIRFRSDAARSGKGFLASYLAIDDNECDRQVCTFPSLCRNTVGSYACDCPEGYDNRGRRSSTKCIDVDECKLGTARCDHICANTQGSYYCQCRIGYRLAPDGQRCKDVNECKKNNGGCSHFCRNTKSSYRCLCPKGYTLYTDQRSCFPEITFEHDQYMANIRENSRPGTLLTTIKAKSFSMASSQSSITYKLISGNLNALTKFSIDNRSGEIRTVGSLDREKTASYLLEVSAGVHYANGSFRIGSSTYVIVNILDENDNTPVFVTPFLKVKVPCNVTVGKILHRMIAKDKDSGDNGKVKFRFLHKHSFFSILPNTGKVRVLKSLVRFCSSSPTKKFGLIIFASDKGAIPKMAEAHVQLEVTPPGKLRNLSVLVMHARFFDPGQDNSDTITKRQIHPGNKLKKKK